ncbi:site-specific integrase [Mesorhizobium sp.]|uniref:tyrosine-type recombinase/integrase n=1 Tax=Mesorhizobium sp. TaxID=1871066 RepID=UPI000FE73376|nr:site-specific integrase [Mesorhizobium sp.]RWK65091.1 MAG: site-specific integrase [Mesorhizobium sp.]RWM43247.1 MAG: site-specific integrase [Mesorhizobium sp.]RWM56409.1 MAG: site-specific integrase [Mesorhizobium sp.]RWM60934.1 MAG: site-specific integrase [Mesorhizobium sp.]RWN05310.1 MAG: site-specific integrase [Mesorhizobium sp.]
MRALNRLSAIAVKKLAPGKHADGGGLWLLRRDDGGGQWFLRYTIHGRRREMGLGSITEVSLKEARDGADKWRAVSRAGKDPIKVRDREKREAARNLHVLADIAKDAFESRKAELKGDGKAGRWYTPLKLHVLPKLGKVPVGEINQRDIRDTLAPIWHAKADTARKAMNRLSICLKYAAALGLEVDLQATDKARALLGRQRHKAENIPAMPWSHLPAFYATLKDDNITHLALRLLILTGVRSAPIRHIHQDQIEGDVWTVPAEAMKGRRDATTEFRVPLSVEALAVIERAQEFERDGYFFANPKKGVISDMAMSQHMKRAKLEYRPHGFRSSLRDWLAEATDARHEVAETMLGHTIGSSVERSYRRTDYLDQRRELLDRWAIHVTSHVGKNYRARVRL